MKKISKQGRMRAQRAMVLLAVGGMLELNAGGGANFMPGLVGSSTGGCLKFGV